MKIMIILSLLLNIIALLPVCTGLITNAPWTLSSYGEVSPARGILLSIYLTIAFTSVLLMIFYNTAVTSTLLFLQIIYKLTTPLTVGTLQNPVVISNLGIAAFHIVTLAIVWRTIDHPLR